MFSSLAAFSPTAENHFLLWAKLSIRPVEETTDETCLVIEKLQRFTNGLTLRRSTFTDRLAIHSSPFAPLAVLSLRLPLALCHTLCLTHIHTDLRSVCALFNRIWTYSIFMPYLRSSVVHHSLTCHQLHLNWWNMALVDLNDYWKFVAGCKFYAHFSI